MMTSRPGQHGMTGWLHSGLRRISGGLWILLVSTMLTTTTTRTPFSRDHHNHHQQHFSGILFVQGQKSPESSYVEFQPQIQDNIKEDDMSAASSSRSDCPKVCSCYHSYTARREIPGGFVLNVDCSQRGLSDFPIGIPKEAYTLDMSGNKLINITSLPRLNALSELDLSDNWLRHIDNKWVFEHSPTLRVLRLSENRLRYIQHGSFSGLEHLEELDLSMNILTSLDTHALAGLKSLKVLQLDRNQLYDFSREWFMSLTSLIELHASHNHISALESHNLDRLKHLQHLDVSQNALRLIHHEALVGLDNLKLLNLSANTQLTTFPNIAFTKSHIPRLDILLSDDTNMKRLSSFAVSNLSVTELSISFMPRLRVVEKFAVFNCSRLHNLQIHDNPLLVYLHPQAFSHLPSLKRLHIHNNRLIAVPGQIMTSLPALGDLQLHHNPLHCDCNSYWLRKELEPYNVRLQQIRNHRITNTNSNTTDSKTSSTPTSDKNSNKNKINIPGSSPHRTQDSTISSTTTKTTTIIREPDRVSCFFPKSQDNPPSSQPMIQLAFQYFSPKCQPSALPLFPPVINITLGSDLTLECHGLGVPTPTISWLLPNGNELNSSSLVDSNYNNNPKPRLEIVDNTLLKLKNVRITDKGIYGCTASNSLGDDMTSVMVRVRNKPLDILGVEVGYDYITVALVGNIPRVELRDFQIYYKKYNNNNNRDSPSAVDKINGDTLSSKSGYGVMRFTTHGSFHRLKLRSLTPHTRYKVCLVYKDSHLVSCKTWTTSNVMRVVNRHSGIVRVSKTQVIAAIVGSLASVVFLMLLVAFVRRRKKAMGGYQESGGQQRRDDKASSIPMDGMLLSKCTNPSLNSSRTALLSNSHL